MWELIFETIVLLCTNLFSLGVKRLGCHYDRFILLLLLFL